MPEFVFSIDELKKELGRIQCEDPAKYEKFVAACIGFRIGYKAAELGIKIEGITQ